MWLWLSAIAGLSFCVMSSPLLAEDVPVPEPKNYRTQDYRAPTPNSLEGAQVLSTDQAAEVWRGGKAAFVDVLPQPPRPVDLPQGTLWRDKPRLNIPGSIWLPDTGYGALNPAMEDYFRSGLERASGGDRSRILVFYCLKDCWMSWNAAKRAQSLGYTHVDWYPDGTDGWQAAGLPLETSSPVPRPSG